MRVTVSPFPDGRVRTVQRLPTLKLVDAPFSPHLSTAPIPLATAPAKASAERDDPEIGPQRWYAAFLSAFLVGLLGLGGFWIWFNVPLL